MRIPRTLAAALCFALTLLPLTVLAQGPELRLLEPMPDGVILGDSVSVIFEASGVQIIPSPVKRAEFGKRPDANRPDQGHLNLMLDLNPVAIWEKTDPYVFTNVPPGNHLLTIEVVNNDGSPRTPPLLLQRRIEVRPDQPGVAPGTIMSLPNTGATGEVLYQRLNLLLLATTMILLGLIIRRYVSGLVQGPAA